MRLDDESVNWPRGRRKDAELQDRGLTVNRVTAAQIRAMPEEIIARLRARTG
jgi:hypothetical protein